MSNTDPTKDKDSDTDTAPLYLDAFAIHDAPTPLVPGRSTRAWMDATSSRFAYRCLPLTMANATGWELLSPLTIDIVWNGGPAKEDVVISSPQPGAAINSFAQSHFADGIVTFHTGYLFRTPPGWAIWCMGPPNWPKDGIYPLSGLIETDWLPFTFTMNWKMTRPGVVRFEQGEPYGFLTLTEHRRLDAVEPSIRRLDSDPALQEDFRAWSESRETFLKDLRARDPDAVAAGWQRHYMRGEPPGGKALDAEHDTKRRLKPPKDMRGG